MPLPPPPPPGPPPPPTFNPPPPPSAKNDPNNRNQLLSEIRKGTGLKKVVTNDRSAPAIETKSSGKSSSGGGVANGGPPGLAGLFAGGMPKLKPSGTPKGAALLPPGRRAQDDSGTFNDESGSQSYPSSPQIKSKTTGLPAGFGTVRKGFLGEAMKAHAPQPPPATMKPNGRPAGPPLPNKPPNVAGVKLNFNKVAPPSNKPPPPPKSPAVQNAVPPALPSKPPSCRRHQSFNEYDVRPVSRNGDKRPQLKVSPTDNGSAVVSPDSLNVRPPSFKNVSTPNLVAVGKAPPPPPPPARDPVPLSQQQQQQYHTMPTKLNAAPPPPPPNRTTPYTPKPPPPSSRPPPPPPSKLIVTSPPTPPPPPPHRVNPAPPPPPPQQQQQQPLQLTVPTSGGRGGVAMIPTSSLPPPPPVRNSSARNSLSGSSLTLASSNNGADDLFESRVYHMFVSVNSLPAPDPFTNSPKTYASKNIQGQSRRDAAPPIPGDGGAHTQLQFGQKFFPNPTTEC